MNRNKIVRIGAIVMIMSLLITIFIGAMSIQPSKASTRPHSAPTLPAGVTTPTPAPMPSSPTRTFDPSQVGPNADLDHDGIPNNEDPDIDGDGLPNGVDPDIDGDGIPNGQDGNPASTNLVDSSAPGQFAADRAWQWAGGALVLAVLGWLVALPYVRRRRGASSKSVGDRGK